MLRIVVAGSRDFEDYNMLEEALDNLLDDQEDEVEFVSGHAKGAGQMAEQYAESHDIPIQIMKPDWKRYGRAAGVVRNKEMLVYADQESAQLLAFWDGKSSGTRNTINTAMARRWML